MSATDTDEPRAKKRKTKNPSHQACTVCKARKVRCDAIRPRCSFCASHNTTCVFTPVYKRANCSQAYDSMPLSTFVFTFASNGSANPGRVTSVMSTT